MLITGETSTEDLDSIYIGDRITFEERSGLVYRIAIFKSVSVFSYVFQLDNGKLIIIRRNWYK